MADRPWYQDVPLPQLMREARDVYRDAVARALAGAGCDDVSRNGPFVLADLDQASPDPKFSPQADVVASLGLSKQAASQLIDTPVLREYLERCNDPVDWRRMEPVVIVTLVNPECGPILWSRRSDIPLIGY
jgi:DNA-binding MarR family transcriptional regulator